MSWYALRTEPNREIIAKRHLESWVDDIYMPVCDRTTILDLTKEVIYLREDGESETFRISVGSQRVSGLILRGYLFIRLEMSYAAAAEIGSTNGVIKLIPNNRRPEAIDDEDFARLQKSCADLAASTVPEKSYQWMIGKNLRILEGTYAGFSGYCRDVIKSHAIISLEMFKSVVPVPVPVECIAEEPTRVGVDTTRIRSYIPGISKRRGSART